MPKTAEHSSRSRSVRPFGARPLLNFALVIALPVLLVYVSAGALVVAGLRAMAQDIDRLEENRGVTGMHAALDTFLNDLSNAVADEGTWDEAYLNVVVQPNPAWMDTTWGATARLGQGYDNVLVTKQDGSIVFGENGVGAITGNVADRFPSAKTMLAQLDQGITATGDATTVSHFAVDKDGLAGLVAVSIHKSSATDFAVPDEARRILWISRHMTPALLQDISARYQIPLASITDSVEPGQSSTDLLDADGRSAGTLVWTPEHPGAAAFAREMLIASAVLFALGAALVAGLIFLCRAMLRRAAAIQSEVAHVLAHAAAPVTTAVPATHNEVVAIDDFGPADSNPIDGIVASDFEIEYQPVFDLRAETLIGAEALLRWKRPDKSVLLQETLRPAQNAALLERIGIMAVRRAADEMAPLLGMVLSVEVGPLQLMNPVFAEKIAATLAATNFPGRRLQLVLNATRLPPPNELRVALDGFAASNVTVGFSDFALGAQTIAYAQAGLAQRIRLPGAIVHGVAGDATRFALIETTLNVARTIGWDVTVPFVERKEDAAKLLRLGCREFQGPLLAPPMPIAALTALILNPAQKKAS